MYAGFWERVAALSWASQLNQKDIVDLLIQSGAKPLLIDPRTGKKTLIR